MSVEAAFFDLDGCLVDSRAPITAAINHALLGTFETLLGARGVPARARTRPAGTAR